MKRQDIDTLPKLFCEGNHKLHMLVATIEKAQIVRDNKKVYYEWICDLCGRVYRLEAPEVIILEKDDKNDKSKQDATIHIHRGKSFEEDRANSKKDL